MQSRRRRFCDGETGSVGDVPAVGLGSDGGRCGADWGLSVMLLPMTSRKRARPRGAGPPDRAGVVAPNPHRQITMTAKDDTPDSGHESIDFRTDEKRLEKMSSRKLAEVLEEQKQATREAASAVDRALLNEDVPLTDEKVQALWEAGAAVETIARVLAVRVDPEHRIECDESEADSEKRGGQQR